MLLVIIYQWSIHEIYFLSKYEIKPKLKVLIWENLYTSQKLSFIDLAVGVKSSYSYNVSILKFNPLIFLQIY